MTLVNRVSAFFLAALAVALVSYSATFYLLIRNHLVRQFDEDLHSALQILASSVEVEQDDAKWNPVEHGVNFHEGKLNDVEWSISDETGQVIDRSPALDRPDPDQRRAVRYASQASGDSSTPAEFGSWRVLSRELSAPAPKPLTLREPHEYAKVRVAVMRSQLELVTTLKKLAALVCIVPALVWLAAAAIGHRFVRHALRPVRAMADRARSATLADFNLRLPIEPSRDELSELGNSFNQLLDQLQAAFERQQRFTGDAAHQLRNPLAVLQGQIDVARRRPRTSEEYLRTLDVLADQTTELRQLVESLLFLARSEGDSSAPLAEAIAIDEWLAIYWTRWDQHPRRADLDLHANSHSRIIASPPLLTQILDNLMSNALKYSRPGDKVIVSSTREDDKVQLSVADHGIGIPQRDRTAIFEPFYRSEDVRKQGIPGTGLGLSVAARIASVLDGSLTVDDNGGQGTAVTLSVPANDRT